MKTIKAIVFGALITICSASALMMFIFMGATDVENISEAFKWFAVTFLTLLGSAYAIKFLYERWYK